MAIMGCCIKVVKRRAKSTVASLPVNQNHFNNVTHNKDLVALGRSFSLGLLVVFGFCSKIIFSYYIADFDEEVQAILSQLLYELFHPLVATIFSPLTIILFNSEIRSTLKKLMCRNTRIYWIRKIEKPLSWLTRIFFSGEKADFPFSLLAKSFSLWCHTQTPKSPKSVRPCVLASIKW